MSRFLFLPMPGHGHVNPTLAVAAELVDRGHQVTYLLPERFRDPVKASGAEFAGYEAEPLEPGPAGGSPLASLFRQLTAIAEQVADPLLELYDGLAPDLVVGESFSLWGSLLVAARSAKGVQLAPSYVMGPQSPVARAAGDAGGPPPVDPARLAAVAARYGAQLENPVATVLRRTLPTVVFMPAEFHPAPTEFDPPAYFVGPALGRPEADDGFDLSRLEATPGIYVSLGTVFNERKDFFEACLEAFGGGERPLVLNHGVRLSATDFPDAPDDVVLASHVPQLRVLEHSAVFVTHGGMGSTMEALAHGVPMVVVPQMIEQRVTAERVAELGLGVWLDPADVTPRALADAVSTVLSDPSYRAACARMREVVRGAGGARAAADVLVAAAAG